MHGLINQGYGQEHAHAQAVGIVTAAKELQLVEQMVRNWVNTAKGSKPLTNAAKEVTPEQMELSICAQRTRG